MKFRRYSCSFPSKLYKDISNLKSSGKVFTTADKRSNLLKDDYYRLLNNAVISMYRKANKNIAKIINNQVKQFGEKKKRNK